MKKEKTPFKEVKDFLEERFSDFIIMGKSKKGQYLIGSVGKKRELAVMLAAILADNPDLFLMALLVSSGKVTMIPATGEN